MNINLMTYYYELKESLEHELVNFASQVQMWKESGVINNETFERCKTYAEHIQADIQQMETEKEHFFNCINNLSNSRYQQAIMERLVYDKKWDDVADAMKLSSQHIQKRIYPAALKEFNALLGTNLDCPDLATEQG